MTDTLLQIPGLVNDITETFVTTNKLLPSENQRLRWSKGKGFRNDPGIQSNNFSETMQLIS